MKTYKKNISFLNMLINNKYASDDDEGRMMEWSLSLLFKKD